MTEASDPETGFLEQLGQRVRTMRALRGMSRKVLAKVSGISERYIAQLESGKGNVSIVLLRRVSNAMGAHLEDLIPATEPAPDWMQMNIGPLGHFSSSTPSSDPTPVPENAKWQRRAFRDLEARLGLLE